MDEKEKSSRGISLRKKKKDRPKISAPKQISGPLPENLQGPAIPDEFRQKAQAAREQAAAAAAAAASEGESPGGGQPLNAPRERPQPAASGKTSDLVKRRYSTRFNQLPNEGPPGGPPLPAVPGIPKQFAPPPPVAEGKPIRTDGRGIKVDIKALRDPSLRPEQYVASLLADASEADIQRYQEDLRKVKNRTSSDLQHNVYQNRTQFIKISKEADKLKGEMRTLRALMSDLTSTLGQATSSSSFKSPDTGSSRRNANRSSVANLEALWNTHLQTLWKRVEGSQKFLPAIPGRHIVYESGRWVELNAATWKVRRRVHLILLNDHLLVAAEKKRTDAPQNSRDAKQAQQHTQLVAVRCWPLQDVQMVDLSTKTNAGRDQGEKKRAADSINVRVGTESFTFANPGSDQVEKATLLSSFRKATEDLRKNLEAETEERSKTNDSVNYYATRDLSVLKEQDLLEGLGESASQNRSSLFVDVDGKRQSIRWVESQLDELDIDIALHRFEAAVEKVDRLRRISKSIKGNPLAQEIFQHKGNERAAKLAGLLTRQLQETHNWPTATKKHVDWLIQLGFEDRARESYLEARSGIIKKRIRQCVFDGDLHQYIFQISFIYFTLIRNTVVTYQSCFQATMMSACVKWAKDHVEDFNSILSRQLSTIDEESTMWEECMARAREHGSMLSEVGLDFKDLVGKGVRLRDSGIDLSTGRSAEDGPAGLGLTT
ncbi:Vps51/Vps67 [Lasiodiplodia theobromae]|uniref:Exocyst complex component EXO84 n=1 Tax=Lasiodiplodia theobromae TaxID=45133 RepID=A0A5N5DCY4_9PEZI|nr:Exocyst complex component [Lasiodiplodia theobromae]KAB2575467.1 Exocyst complex component exo84 [Lasiodiplodia theobromae]KAF4546109.1 Exocyst complex component [Lasiodiplodia theobromae]KAF9635159.1 Vps51/Vps67 [Lasiodiplodia theobromae]